MIDAELEAVKIPKFGGGKSHSGYPNPKSQYPPPPRGPISLGEKELFYIYYDKSYSIYIMNRLICHTATLSSTQLRKRHDVYRF